MHGHTATTIGACVTGKGKFVRFAQHLNAETQGQGQRQIESQNTPPKDKERRFCKYIKISNLREVFYQGLSGYPDSACRVVINQQVRVHMAGFIRMFKLAEVGAKLAPLSEASQLVYWMLLDTADWRYGRVLITQEVIADSLVKSVRTIERATKELIKVGLVRHAKGIYAINPEFAWGGRSWNIPKATYHAMGGKTAQVISFKAMAQAMSEEALERVGRETLREVSARKPKGTKTC